jgi:hypothetical protein
MAKKWGFLVLLSIGLASFVSADYWYYIESHTFVADEWQTLNCYSGKGLFKNDPNATNRVNEGPIPVGDYYIVGVRPNDSKGRPTIELQPAFNAPYSRWGFLIHGDNGNGTASEGCIVIEDSKYRQRVASDYNKGVCGMLHVRP